MLNGALLVIDDTGLLVLDSLPGLIALALLRGAPNDPARDVDHRYARQQANRFEDDTRWIDVVQVIGVDERTRLVDEPAGDVLASEGASVGTDAEVADVCAPVADVGTANGRDGSWP